MLPAAVEPALMLVKGIADYLNLVLFILYCCRCCGNAFHQVLTDFSLVVKTPLGVEKGGLCIVIH